MAITPPSDPPPRPAGGFWVNQSGTAAQRVLVPTGGDSQSIPYHFLKGTAPEGLETPEIDAGVDALFPAYDGDVVKLSPKPEGFDTIPEALDPEIFQSWHSAHQLEYVIKNKELNSDPPKRLIGISFPAEDQLRVLVSTDGQRLYIIQNLTKQSLALIPKEDQELIAADDWFQTLKAEELGLRPMANDIGTHESVETVRAEMKALVDAKAATFVQGGRMDADNLAIFTDQLGFIKERLDNMAVFSEQAIVEQLNAIEERYKRAFDFADIVAEEPGSSTGQIKNVISLDNNATVNRGFDVFMAHEEKIRDIEAEKLKLSKRTGQTDKALDVPNLVFLFQFYYNLSGEAKVAAETEEINQQNALLKDYAQIQRLLNETLKKFTPGNNDQAVSFLGKGNISELTEEEQRIISMFEDGLAGQLHPIEKMRGLPRIKQDILSNEFQDLETDIQAGQLEGKKKNVWDYFGTQLSDNVTQINQSTQIKMNDINSMDKQRNRHYDLANNALSKMNDMIMSIGRAVGG